MSGAQSKTVHTVTHFMTSRYYASTALSMTSPEVIIGCCRVLDFILFYLFNYQPTHYHMKSYYVYIAKCADDSYYTGVTNDLERRLSEHNSGRDSGHTLSHVVLSKLSLRTNSMTSSKRLHLKSRLRVGVEKRKEQ